MVSRQHCYEYDLFRYLTTSHGLWVWNSIQGWKRKCRESRTNALSRISNMLTHVQALAMSTVSFELVREIEAILGERCLQKFISELKQGGSNNKYTWSNEQLGRKGKLWLGLILSLSWNCCNYFTLRHSGVLVTTKRIAGIVYWKGVEESSEELR